MTQETSRCTHPLAHGPSMCVHFDHPSFFCQERHLRDVVNICPTTWSLTPHLQDAMFSWRCGSVCREYVSKKSTDVQHSNCVTDKLLHMKRFMIYFQETSIDEKCVVQTNLKWSMLVFLRIRVIKWHIYIIHKIYVKIFASLSHFELLSDTRRRRTVRFPCGFVERTICLCNINDV